VRKTFFALFFLAVSIPYSFEWGWNTILNPEYLEKPFVFRALVPTMASMFSNREMAVNVIVLLFCIGLGWVMSELVDLKWRRILWNELAIIVSFSATLLILDRYKKVYDVPSVFFFALLLLLWAKKKYLLSIPVFALACLNRETAVLIIPVLFLIGRSWKYAIVQVVIFVAIRAMLVWVYGDAPGQEFFIRPMQSLAVHMDNILATLAIVAVGLGAYLLVLLKWRRGYYGVSVFVALLFPALCLVYIVFGYPFEVRVFGEVMPILFMGAFLR
jgi:hypothetical protein